MRTKRKMPDRPAPPPGPVTVTRVYPETWWTALRLAEGDRDRLVIISATEIIVTNKSTKGSRA